MSLSILAFRALALDKDRSGKLSIPPITMPKATQENNKSGKYFSFDFIYEKKWYSWLFQLINFGDFHAGFSEEI